VTTLIAELMTKGIVDGVLTSAAVIAHEMAGVLDKVKRMDGRQVGVDAALLPKGYTFEITEMTAAELATLRHEMLIDDELLARCRQAEGNVIIKAAGNMAYPLGLRSERLAREILSLAQAYGLPFETVAGWGADPRTMIGAGARQAHGHFTSEHATAADHCGCLAMKREDVHVNESFPSEAGSSNI
jgi:hypothetical protein